MIRAQTITETPITIVRHVNTGQTKVGTSSRDFPTKPRPTLTILPHESLLVNLVQELDVVAVHKLLEALADPVPARVAPPHRLAVEVPQQEAASAHELVHGVQGEQLVVLRGVVPVVDRQDVPVVQVKVPRLALHAGRRPNPHLVETNVFVENGHDATFMGGSVGSLDDIVGTEIQAVFLVEVRLLDEGRVDFMFVQVFRQLAHFRPNPVAVPLQNSKVPGVRGSQYSFERLQGHDRNSESQ